MFKSNEEIIAEIMPNENTILILKKDLQLRLGILTKGTRVILRYGGECGNWYEVISSNGCYLHTNSIYLNDIIQKKGELILKDDVPKYQKRIQKFFREYFMIDVDKTKEYNAFLEEKHINVGIILFTFFWFVGLIAISILGWVNGTWCDSGIFHLPSGNIVTGILCNLIFGAAWCILELMGITMLGYEQIESLRRKNEKKICQLLNSERKEVLMYNVPKK